MNKEEQERLLEKYLEGKTTLQEEETLKDVLKDTDHEANSWFKYLTEESKQAPSYLTDSLWEESKIHEQKRNYWKSILLISSMFIALLLASLAYSNHKNTQDYESKKQLLEEAIRFANNINSEPTKEVLYTDNTLTIYIVQNQ